MALSNIFIEPKRELIESGVGTGVFLLGLAVVGIWTRYVYILGTGKIDQIPMTLVVGILMGTLAVFLGPFVLYGIFFLFPHTIGEAICNSLARHGKELRPQERYRLDHTGKRVLKNSPYY